MSSENGMLAKILPIIMNTGEPGGWGIPNITEAATNSPQSQNEIDGAKVLRYIARAMTKVMNPIMMFVRSRFGLLSTI